MKNRLPVCLLALCFTTFLAFGTARAQSTTSPQGTAAIYTGSAVCVGASSGGSTLGGSTTPAPCTDSNGNGNWFTVMNASVKTSNTTDLFVNPSLVTGLYTNTQTNGNKNNVTTQIATAMGAVTVRVLLDCSECAAVGQAQESDPTWAAAGYPDPSGNGVTFDQRTQTLSTQLGQAITTSCLTFDSTTGTLSNTCSPEQLDLILDTTSAHSFNFIFLNVGSGVHTLTVQARLDASANTSCTDASNCTTTNTILPSSVAAALFGLGSMTALPVHLAPGFSSRKPGTATGRVATGAANSSCRMRLFSENRVTALPASERCHRFDKQCGANPAV